MACLQVPAGGSRTVLAEDFRRVLVGECLQARGEGCQLGPEVECLLVLGGVFQQARAVVVAADLAQEPTVGIGQIQTVNKATGHDRPEPAVTITGIRSNNGNDGILCDTARPGYGLQPNLAKSWFRKTGPPSATQSCPRRREALATNRTPRWATRKTIKGLEPPCPAML